jgi:hypothetical protein
MIMDIVADKLFVYCKLNFCFELCHLFDNNDLPDSLKKVDDIRCDRFIHVDVYVALCIPYIHLLYSSILYIHGHCLHCKLGAS